MAAQAVIPAAYEWSRVFARPPVAGVVSAIVVSYRTGPVLFDCLRALLADPDICSIVVVNNGNPQRTLARLNALADADPRVIVTGGGENRGFAAGVNLGAQFATGERLLVINPDAILRAGSIAAFERAYAMGSEPVIVGGKIFDLRGREQRGARRRRITLARAAAKLIGHDRINRHDAAEPSGPVDMETLSGALMYFSRAGFNWLHGFDEGYFLHVEDIDICRRAEIEGGSVIYTPHAAALHIGGTSDAPSTIVEKHKAAGFKRYFSKFASSPAERALVAVLGPAIDAAMMARRIWREITVRRP
jgi:GT2 family glycosyltransferase